MTECSSLPPLRRRRMLASVAALPFLARAAQTHAASPRKPSAAAKDSPVPPTDIALPDDAALLAAGPEGGRIERWGKLILPPLQRGLPGGEGLRLISAGGLDGVTGANQFEARVAPDGGTTLLVPGAAGMAWLVGDPRAQFDAAQWVPVLAGATPGVVVGRVEMDRLTPGQKLRVPVSSPVSADISAMLALELLGLQPLPVLGIGQETMTQAFANHAIDVVFLHGLRVSDRVALLESRGGISLFSFGAIADSGHWSRDPAFPNLPHVGELRVTGPATARSAGLFTAWRATAAAAQMEFGMMLPKLTSAASVASWRRAGAGVTTSPEVMETCAAECVRPLASPTATAMIGSLATNTGALLELRRWMAARLNWQSG